MPARPESLTITDVYGAQLRRLRDLIVRILGERWHQVDPADLDRTFRVWMATAIELVALAQREAVGLSDAYLASFLSSELQTAVSPAGLDPEAYAGHTRDGRPLRDVFALPLVATKLALTQAQPMSAALDIGRARAVRATRTEVMEASRTSLSDAMATEKRVVGYRRVVHSGHPCGACLGLAGERRGSGQNLAIHAGCSCTAEPIVEGVRERATRPDGPAMFDAMTPAQQDRLFAGRGGAQKADLIRSGSATLSDLVSTTENPEWGTTIFETPLEALAS